MDTEVTKTSGSEAVIYPTEEAARAALGPALRQLEEISNGLKVLGAIANVEQLATVTEARKIAKAHKSGLASKLKALLAPFRSGLAGIEVLYKPTITVAGELVALTDQMITAYDAKVRREAEEAAREHARRLEEARVLREAEVDAYAEDERREARKAAQAELDRIEAERVIEEGKEKARQLLAAAAKTETEGNLQAADGYRDMAEEVKEAIPDAPDAPLITPEPKPAPAPWIPPPPPVAAPVASPRQVFAASPVVMIDNWVAEAQSVELLILAAAQEIEDGPAEWLPKGLTLLGLLGINQAAANNIARQVRHEREVAGLLIVNRRYPRTK